MTDNIGERIASLETEVGTLKGRALEEDSIGERIAGLEAEFRGFCQEILYIKDRVDKIAEAMPNKVDRVFCFGRHEKLGEKVAELEMDGGRKELMERVRALEQRVPAMVQSVVAAVLTAVLTAVAVRAIP